VVRGLLNRGDVFLETNQEKPLLIELDKRDCIPGLRMGIVGMRVGGRRTLIVSPHLGYGDKGLPERGWVEDRPQVLAHGHQHPRVMKNFQPLRPFTRSGAARRGGLLLLAGGGLGGEGGAFLLAGGVRLGLFLAGLLLVGFRGFVAHNFDFGSAV
jgi:hypothetical protein